MDVCGLDFVASEFRNVERPKNFDIFSQTIKQTSKYRKIQINAQTIEHTNTHTNIFMRKLFDMRQRN